MLMPWSAVPFEDKQRRERLADKFGIRGEELAQAYQSRLWLSLVYLDQSVLPRYTAPGFA